MSLYSIVQVASASVPNAPTGRFILFLDTDGIWKKKDDAGNVTPVSADDLNDKVKVSANDTTEGYLEDKIQGLTNKISVSTLNDGSNESFQITIGSDVFDVTVNDSDDITEGAVNLFLTTGERSLIASALQSGDNVSELTNDARYITTITGSNHSQLNLDDGTNPHGTTKADVGLSNVDNTSDADKPVSTATQAAIDALSFSVDLDSAESTVTRVEVGGRTNFTVTHSMNTLDVIPDIYRLSDGRSLNWRVERTNVNTVVASRAGSVANGLFRIVLNK